MTGVPPVLDRPALWAALSHMQIAEPGTGRRFEAALAEENGWPLPFVQRVADEYFGFLYLAATAGFEVTPSRTVDEAWHLHLRWPHYREVLCERVLGRPLEHRPADGTADDEARCRRQYEQTLALYERVFGKPPPDDVWPRPLAPAAAEEDEEEGLDPAYRRRRRLGRRIAFAGLAASLAALAFGAPAIAAALFVAALIVFLVGLASHRAAARDRGSGGCGSGACGGASRDGGDDSSSSSCGGGGDSSCGGGGCGGD